MMKSLLERGLDVFLNADPDEKATLTLEIAEDWFSGSITEIFPHSFTIKSKLPIYPSRPNFVKTVPPSKVKSRGIIGMLHGIVHAESYAIDLSWDIMLRFAEDNKEFLPVKFFSDWVRVAQEEALHYSRWRDRLIELGSYYGERLSHDTLWNAALIADTLIKRLALVHMTHESRGLDTYSIALNKLNNVDDNVSINILNKNIRDEITHVGAGVEWFEFLFNCQMKNGNSALIELGVNSPVECYHEIIKRHFDGLIKGPFNHEDRESAGMHSDYYVPLVSYYEEVVKERRRKNGLQLDLTKTPPKLKQMTKFPSYSVAYNNLHVLPSDINQCFHGFGLFSSRGNRVL